MIDVVYLAGSVLFFALMVGYAAACNRLGRAATVDQAREDAQ